MHDLCHFPLEHPAYKANVVRVHQNKYFVAFKMENIY